GQIVSQYGSVLRRDALPAAVEAALQDVESADLLLVASPIYRGTYTGLFKHFFDFVHHDSLIDVPVLLAATGGSDRHALAIDHQLRPLFSFFQAHTLPIGVYAADREFENHRVHSDALHARIALAVERAVPVLRQRVPRAAASALPALA
ncbi:MAG: FMN reductase, partial [Comamonadaceae bacterium]